MQAFVIDDSRAMRSTVKPFTPDAVTAKLALLGLVAA